MLSWPVLWFIAPLFLRARLVIVSKDGKVLLVKHSFGSEKWTLPGGGVKHTETPREAASREVQEELDLVIEVNDISALSTKPSIYSVSGLLFRALFYKTTLPTTTIDTKIVASYEISQVEWFRQDSEEVQKALPKEITL